MLFKTPFFRQHSTLYRIERDLQVLAVDGSTYFPYKLLLSALRIGESADQSNIVPAPASASLELTIIGHRTFHGD